MARSNIITAKIEQLISVSELSTAAFTQAQANYSYTETPKQLHSRIDQLNVIVDQARCFASLVSDLAMDISSEYATEAQSREVTNDDN